MRKFLLCMSVLVVSGSVFAATKSSTIKLDDAIALPQQIAEVDFDKLLDNVNYKVTCTISSNGLSKQNRDDIQFLTSGHGIVVNGKELTIDNQIVSIPTGESSVLELFKVSRGGMYIEIHNLDDTDTVTVSNCLAKPQNYLS